MQGKDDPPTPPSPAAHFQYNRVPRDRIWALLFAVTWAVCIGMGCYAVSHRCVAAGQEGGKGSGTRVGAVLEPTPTPQGLCVCVGGGGA